MSDQVSGWQKLGNEIPSQLTKSQQHFQNLKTELEKFLSSRKDVDESTLTNLWSREGGNPQTDHNFFTSDCSETTFLVSLQKTSPKTVSGAHAFLVGTPSLNNHENILGTLLAYEFRRSELPKFSHRKLAEGESIKGLINKFSSQISESETELSKHLSGAVSKCEEFAVSIDSLKESKDIMFQEWFETTKSEFSNFDENSKEIIDAFILASQKYKETKKK